MENIYPDFKKLKKEIIKENKKFKFFIDIFKHKLVNNFIFENSLEFEEYCEENFKRLLYELNCPDAPDNDWVTKRNFKKLIKLKNGKI